MSMDEQCYSDDEGHSEKLTTEIPEHFSHLDYKPFERTYPGLPLPPVTQDLFDEAAKTIKPPEEWDLNPIPTINLDDRNIMDRIRFNGKGVQIDVGSAGGVAAVLGMLLLSAAGRGESERTREAEREAQEARHAQEQERLAREEAERATEEARRLQEQERLAREEAERKEKLERSLRELGVPPDRKISEADIRDARLEAGYKEGLVNIVVVGNRGMGKSTLVNSLRGLGPRASGRAEVGEVEMTSQRTQYIDPLHSGIVWYDIPGAGTDKTTAWQYYYNQKLFIFDKIVLVHDTTLTEPDLRILKLCKYRNQECIVLRSKADMHIRNRARRMQLDPNNARQDYISDVRRDTDTSNARNETGSPEELALLVTDYIVSEMGVLQLVTNSQPSADPVEQVIDEALLLQKLGLLP